MNKWRRRLPRLLLLALLVCAFLCPVGCKPRQSGGEENLVRVYVAHNEKQYTAAVKEFQERTGIAVEIVSAGTGDCLQRIASEADNPQCDVMWGGTVESLEAYVAYFQPYVCAEDEFIADAFKDPNDLWIGESQQPAVIMYNRNLVANSDIPVVWEDLLDPKWKGQIASADPASSGSAYTLLCNIILAVSQKPDKSDGWAFVTALLDNVVISGGSSTVYQGAGAARLPVCAGKSRRRRHALSRGRLLQRAGRRSAGQRLSARRKRQAVYRLSAQRGLPAVHERGVRPSFRPQRHSAAGEPSRFKLDLLYRLRLRMGGRWKGNRSAAVAGDAGTERAVTRLGNCSKRGF